MPDEERPDHEDGDDREDEAAESGEDAPRVPELEPDERETKRFMVGDGPEGSSLSIRVSGGDVARNYGPAKLLGELAEYVADLVQSFNGGRAMIYGLVPGRSMVIYFGDPQVEEVQTELPIQQTRAAAEAVGALMDLDESDVFRRATELAPSQVRAYDELARFVASEGVQLDWAPRDSRVRTLSPERAGTHHRRLNVEPELQGREMTIDGVLYRMIEDPVRRVGRIGIGIFKGSAEPPGYRAPSKVLIDFEGADLHDNLKGLMGEVVKAHIDVRTPKLGTAVDLSRVELVLLDIERGEGDAARYGEPLFELHEGAE